MPASRACRAGATCRRSGGRSSKCSRAELPDWQIVEEHHLRKEFRFRNFRETLDFVGRVGALAEERAHHPDIDFGWGRAGITIYTHKIDGLTESDFVLAARIDQLERGGS